MIGREHALPRRACLRAYGEPASVPTPSVADLFFPPRHLCRSWGSARNGRLGSGMYEDALFPELVPDLDGEHIVDVSDCSTYSLLLGAAVLP